MTLWGMIGWNDVFMNWTQITSLKAFKVLISENKCKTINIEFLTILCEEVVYEPLKNQVLVLWTLEAIFVFRLRDGNQKMSRYLDG